jgi:hypothetical protein
VFDGDNFMINQEWGEGAGLGGGGGFAGV